MKTLQWIKHFPAVLKTQTEKHSISVVKSHTNKTPNQTKSKQNHLKSTRKETKSKSETRQAVLSNQLQSNRIN